MNEQDMMQKLKSDPRALKSVMQSADGRYWTRRPAGRRWEHIGAIRHAAAGAVHAGGRGTGAAAGGFPAPVKRGGPQHGRAG